ncbi:unnamed protein product [Phytophthora fragariaefolia]|uniref:Unnamed protein product n=1 Tax=Phytophthora fragariaefolia TaxID=1490495 RepID=A0A9W6U816_9STRA|nr:unnamed protein product [Phytophthora fragariaefolia]
MPPLQQSAAGCSEASELQFWSVGKLLRLLHASKSAENPLETLAQRGIVRHPVGSVDPRRVTSQPTAENQQTAPTADAVTYSSSRVWLTGFLRFGEELDTCDTLHLCDSNARLPSFLLDPNPQLVDQLVLVKRWVVVDKAFGGVRTAGSMFLEVHDEKPEPLVPVTSEFADWTREKVMQVLEASFQTKDPPMYTGTEPWAVAAEQSSRGGGDNVLTRNNDAGGAEYSRKHKKRKRVYCVFGRVTSVSPISRQNDRNSSHFFVEIEHPQSWNSSTSQSVATAMFTGVHNMRWHLFLCPGKIVLLTDLVKVFSRECEMFLLQAATGDPAKISAGSPKTTVLVWQDPSSPLEHVGKLITDSMNGYSASFTSLCCGRLMDYEGQVSRLLWDECIEVTGGDGTQVIVCLFHFPYTHEVVRIRKDATIRVFSAHVLRWSTPVGGKLVIGLCPRSHFVITAFSSPSTSCIAMGTRSRRNRAHKKWSTLGDFHCQSMVLSMWLLEVLELLDTKFIFEGGEEMLNGPPLLSFSRIRRRQAIAHVAKKLNLELDYGYVQRATTLGAVFLKCHSDSARSCVTIKLPREKLLKCNRVVTIHELQTLVTNTLKDSRTRGETKASTTASPLSFQISAERLGWCLLLGCIRGNVDGGDLEIFDRTGSMSLQLADNNVSTDFAGEHGVYLIQTFDLTVEDYSQSEDQEGNLPLIFCVSCSAANIEYIPMLGDNEISFSPIDKTLAVVQELFVLVTHVDALPCSEIRQAGLLPEYRVIHGIVCPVAKNLQSQQFMKSAFVADILINTRCINWYVNKGSCYRIKAVEDNRTSEGRSLLRKSVENQAINASTNYLETIGENSVMCCKSLRHMCCSVKGGLSDEECSFRVYRVENELDAIIPIALVCSNFMQARCIKHANCQKSELNPNGMIVSSNDDSLSGKITTLFSNGQPCVKQTSIEVSTSDLVAISILWHFVQQLERVTHVSELLHHPLSNQSQEPVNDDDEQPVLMAMNPELHKAHFVSVVSVITKKTYIWPPASPQQLTTIGVKWDRDAGTDLKTASGSSQQLKCILYIRDLQYLDTVEIHVDASRFGLLGTLQVNSVVEFTRLQGFIARSSYKVYLKWSHQTATRVIRGVVHLPIPSDAELYGSMPTRFLNELYNASCVDRRLHRYVVGVMHISYVLMKRKCVSCHQALQFIRRHGCWQHADPQTGATFLRKCRWRQLRWTPSDPVFKTHTYMGTTVRCVIDDGSGQAEMFLENDVAWELLTCPAGQRRRFEEILSHYADELSYFSGRTASGSFATSRAERELEYYQNELRAFVVDAIPALRSVVVFAQRFYKAKQQREGTSVLTFGKDVHLTTKTAAQPKLEARRVDRLHVRSELRRRLAQLRAADNA